ncbi:MAG TPA: HAD family hydrolase [Anaerovoracaceae bacterium]|nr:HAD family hydrolase [Anaerovoracaceae bacterium]
MIRFQIPGAQLQAELFVFDKDGLLFECEPFWRELAVTRARNFARLVGARIAGSCPAEAVPTDGCPASDTLAPDAPTDGCPAADAPTDSEKLALRWLQIMGVDDLRIDPLGILAASSPDEEITVTAFFLVEHLHLAWAEAQDIAREIFEISDRELDLERAVKPMEGFPDIFRRLRENHAPYGVATLDTYERVEAWIRLYDDWEQVRFVITPKDVSRGKPDREMLDKISELTKVKTSEMVMIGDSSLDVAMAKAAGAIGIGVTKDPEMKKKMQEFTPWIVESLEQIIL